MCLLLTLVISNEWKLITKFSICPFEWCINSNLVYTCKCRQTDCEHVCLQTQWWHHYRAQSMVKTYAHAHNWNSSQKFNRNLCNNNTWIKYHNIFGYSHSRCNQELNITLWHGDDCIRIFVSLWMDCHTMEKNKYLQPVRKAIHFFAECIRLSLCTK